jgi:hypothetical protein
VLGVYIRTVCDGVGLRLDQSDVIERVGLFLLVRAGSVVGNSLVLKQNSTNVSDKFRHLSFPLPIWLS